MVAPGSPPPAPPPDDVDEAHAPRAYDLPHHLEWIDRFKAAVARAVKLAEVPQILPPSAFPLPPPPDPPARVTGLLKLGEPGWVWPLAKHRDGRPPTISDGRHPKGDMRFRNGAGHRGCDIMFQKHKTSPKGAPLNHPWESRGFEVGPRTPACAAGPGIVKVSRWLATGYAVSVDHGFGVETAYHHLSTPLQPKGAYVNAGDSIGIVGAPPAAVNGGREGLVHLHFDLLVGGKFIDPEPYLRSWRVLVPAPPTVA